MIEGDLHVFEVKDFEFIRGQFLDFTFNLFFFVVYGVKKDTFPRVVKIAINLLFLKLFSELFRVLDFVP